MIMKKLFLFLVGAFLVCTSSWAQTLVPLTVSIEEDYTPLGNGFGKTPMRPPVVYIEEHTLTFVADHPEYVLYIKDENNNVVYTTTVYSTQTQVVLPSSLSGDYKIQLDFGGNYFFVGKIEL